MEMSEETKAQVRSACNRLVDAIDGQLVLTAMLIAESSEHGSVFSGGRVNPKTRKKYFFVIATNDAADHLQEWSNKQVDMRSKAAGDAGLAAIVIEKGVAS